MAVKIVTDSSADIPAGLAKDLGITVVPLYVRFGDAVFRDRVDISEDEFYERLVHNGTHPATIQPSPQDFMAAYEPIGKNGDSIISLHISSKLSGTFSSALQARAKLSQYNIEVIDSEYLSAGLGLIVLFAAVQASAGGSFEDINASIRENLPRIKLMGLLDTLKYVLLGGRIGKAKALLGSILNVKPMLTLKDGEVMPVGQARSRSRGIERLIDFVSDEKNVEDIAVAYNTTPDEAQLLIERLKPYFKGNIHLMRIGPMLGVHLGPGTLIVATRSGK